MSFGALGDRDGIFCLQPKKETQESGTEHSIRDLPCCINMYRSRRDRKCVNPKLRVRRPLME